MALFRDAVDPLGCAIPAAPKPRAYIRVRPFDACVSPLEAAGKTCDAMPATLRHRASLRSGRHVPVPAFVACNSPCIAASRCSASLANPLVACDQPVSCTPLYKSVPPGGPAGVDSTGADICAIV